MEIVRALEGFRYQPESVQCCALCSRRVCGVECSLADLKVSFRLLCDSSVCWLQRQVELGSLFDPPIFSQSGRWLMEGGAADSLKFRFVSSCACFPHRTSCAGEYIKTWRRRWFVLKEGRLFWFSSPGITPVSQCSIPTSQPLLHHLLHAPLQKHKCA